MIDQSHNVTDPIESLMQSAIELQRAYAQALIVDRAALEAAQEANDALGAHLELKRAFTTDVSPLLAVARMRAGGAIAPIAAYRASSYRARKARERAVGRRDFGRHRLGKVNHRFQDELTAARLANASAERSAARLDSAQSMTWPIWVFWVDCASRNSAT